VGAHRFQVLDLRVTREHFARALGVIDAVVKKAEASRAVISISKDYRCRTIVTFEGVSHAIVVREAFRHVPRGTERG